MADENKNKRQRLAGGQGGTGASTGDASGYGVGFGGIANPVNVPTIPVKPSSSIKTELNGVIDKLPDITSKYKEIRGQGGGIIPASIGQIGENVKGSINDINSVIKPVYNELFAPVKTPESVSLVKTTTNSETTQPKVDPYSKPATFNTPTGGSATVSFADNRSLSPERQSALQSTINKNADPAFQQRLAAEAERVGTIRSNVLAQNQAEQDRVNSILSNRAAYSDQQALRQAPEVDANQRLFQEALDKGNIKTANLLSGQIDSRRDAEVKRFGIGVDAETARSGQNAQLEVANQNRIADINRARLTSATSLYKDNLENQAKLGENIAKRNQEGISNQQVFSKLISSTEGSELSPRDKLALYHQTTKAPANIDVVKQLHGEDPEFDKALRSRASLYNYVRDAGYSNQDIEGILKSSGL